MFFGQQLVRFCLLIVQKDIMTRLDRLSALMQGLAPRAQLLAHSPTVAGIRFEASARETLFMHVLTRGSMRFQTGAFGGVTVSGPVMLVCRADTAHGLSPASGESLHSLVSVRTFFDGPGASLLLREFEVPLVIALDQADVSLNHIIDLITSEQAQPRCGYPALMDRAGEILFIGLLRHLVAQPQTRSGLFNGLADPRIARTLVALHANPQFNWTLDAMAREAGMSRTSFATKFREIINLPAGKYLENLRLAIAGRTVESGQGLKKAARDSGYASISALSRALSRARTRSDVAGRITA